LEGSPSPATDDWIDVAPLLRQIEDDARALSGVLAGRAETHRFEINFQDRVEIAGAASELQSAFANLAGNAVRYTEPGGTIGISFQLNADGGAVFSVKDTGPGIAPEHLSRLTERFYRVDRSRSRESGGTGLGLAIVKHVAQRHGAELRIESEFGKGATFSIAFPANRVRANDATRNTNQ
jgi:two-component system phosphate regulon sensor histidine kinase PhoR